MAAKRKIIITCAITGAIHTPSMSPHLPVTAGQIAESAIDAAKAAAMGGHVRVGLEDSPWAGPGELALNSAQQVQSVRQIIEGPGQEIATPDEARALLGLKGANRVAF